MGAPVAIWKINKQARFSDIDLKKKQKTSDNNEAFADIYICS